METHYIQTSIEIAQAILFFGLWGSVFFLFARFVAYLISYEPPIRSEDQ